MSQLTVRYWAGKIAPSLSCRGQKQTATLRSMSMAGVDLLAAGFLEKSHLIGRFIYVTRAPVFLQPATSS
jgi:hypothetical protein